MCIFESYPMLHRLGSLKPVNLFLYSLYFNCLELFQHSGQLTGICYQELVLLYEVLSRLCSPIYLVEVVQIVYYSVLINLFSLFNYEGLCLLILHCKPMS